MSEAPKRLTPLGLTLGLIAITVFYLGGYVACRLTGVLARHEHWGSEDERVRAEGGPFDWSREDASTWRTNRIAREWKPEEMTWASRPAAGVYAPLCAIEQWYWNQLWLPHPRQRW